MPSTQPFAFPQDDVTAPLTGLFRALHAALLEAHALDVDLRLLQHHTLRSVFDGIDPRGADAARLAPASAVMDEALAMII